MSKHTSGPWKLEPNGAPFNINRIGGSRLMLLARFDPMEEEEFEANARLIAAAPELLAACRSALEALVFVEEHSEHAWDDVTLHNIGLLGTVIAKATAPAPASADQRGEAR